LILAETGIIYDVKPGMGDSFEEIFENGISEVLDFLGIRNSSISMDFDSNKTWAELISDQKAEESSFLSGFGKYVFDDFYTESLKDTPKKVKSLLRSIEFVSSGRGFTSRIYGSESGLGEMHKIAIKYSKLGKSKEQDTHKFIQDSFRLFGLGDDIEIKNHQGVGAEIWVKRQNDKVLLADLGYGYSQLIPIILKVLLVAIESPYDFMKTENEPTKLFIEEPESNLHPSLQTSLAKFFLLSAHAFNIQFVIETHSEYLIRGLQFLTAKKEIDPWDTQIYYFNNPQTDDFEKEMAREIDIQSNGTLTREFGTGFFDEADRIAYELYRLKLNQN
jgi:hypothetical protein